MIEKGTPISSKIQQADSSYVIKNDGTIEGTLTFVVDKDSIFDLPLIGDDHPDDVRLKCYNKSTTYGSLNTVTCVCSYFGVATTSEKNTEPIISYEGGVNHEPIATHPRWNLIGGEPGSPENGAQYDEDTGEFIGFTGDDAGDLLGVQYYLTPSANFSLTYWTTKTPNLERRLKIVKDPEIGKKMFPRIPTVRNFLLVDMPYRKVGDLYQVTEQYMGSGENGWNEEIYKLMPVGS